MKRLLLALVILSSLFGVAQAGDAAKGQAKATSTCAVCHGANGINVTPVMPNLAGQKALYFINAIKAYQSGSRQDMMMTLLAKSLSDTDIADLAAYYASLSCK